MAEESGEKTEEASSEKLRKAREQGQIAKSQDAVSMLVFLGGCASLSLSLGLLSSRFLSLLFESLSVGVPAHSLESSMSSALEKGSWNVLVLSLPILLVAFFMALIGNYAQVGFLFTTEPLSPDLNRLNPMNGLKQLLSKKKFVEALKQIAKFILSSLIAYFIVRTFLRDLILIHRLGLEHAVFLAFVMIKKLILYVGFFFLVLAAIDYFWQRYTFKKSMMMTKYETKQEYKESEGDPEMKSKRKQLAQELVMYGGQKQVAQADAVITNPTHIAVALRYDAQKSNAPIVIAKGMRLHAQKIKEIAKKNNVPILRNPILAQALHKVELEEEIPQELYEAVAEVLNFVYQLKKDKKEMS